ncbi:sensor histidine kinase [Dyadobacter arcticus]|uniref:histidine kinase n=1 Tax=Dyadobacter arcticus TaxID=1078754 RepID=A0ABX0UQF0_9BACT|nr:HAMP domain-containing sensor histidine kinase [Dyadobacter arcticus]NIJ55211.1 signal transduction histidine kinase [Dyadobacter arcticus]
MSNAIGLVDALGSIEPNSAMHKEVYTHVKSSLQQLDQVIKDLDMILSVRNREGLPDQQDVLLEQIVGQVIQDLRDDINKCRGTVKVSIPSGFLIRTNQANLYSIFFNLLSNTIKYRAEQRPLRVELTAKETAGHGKLITISDNGLGIDLEKVGENMFKLYKRFHPQHSGRGLGLYLVKMHIESIGGQIKVSSQPDQGATFKITLL